MADVFAIIRFLDRYLERSGREYVSAVEANKWLEQSGLLCDSASRPGAPLRRLLREKSIPSARKFGGEWRIYRSGKQVAESPSNPGGFRAADVDISLRESFLPLVGIKPTILILGTLPGVESLHQGEYYANAGNRFWSVVARMADVPVPDTYEGKKNLLFGLGIALWDVCRTARRAGSLDSGLRPEAPNDVTELLGKYPTIDTVAFNGQKAEALYFRYFEPIPGMRYLTLLSSSPANRQYDDSQLYENWRQILQRPGSVRERVFSV